MKKRLYLSLLIVLLLFTTVQSSSTLFLNSQTDGKSSFNYSQTITIYNPYDGIDFDTINHYKANLHTHTTESDGMSSPADVIYHYHEAGGYDILAITDHNKNTWSWSDWIDETPMQSGISTEYYPGLEMLAVSGIELSMRHHRNGLFTDYSYPGFFLNLAFWLIEQQNGLSFFNHPGRYNHNVYWYQRFFDRFDSMVGMEVFNQGDRYQDDRLLWDSINKNRGHDDLIWGFSNDDMHRINDHAFRNYQHFLMNELTEPELKNALRQGSFYFSYELHGSDNTNETYGIAMTPKLIDVKVNDSYIEITAENYDSIYWTNEDTQIISTNTVLDVSMFDSAFVRAVLYNDYGMTYTQPFGITI